MGQFPQGNVKCVDDDTRSTVIGCLAWCCHSYQNSNASYDNVTVGYAAMSANKGSGFRRNTVVGYQALSGNVSNSSYVGCDCCTEDNIVIGANAMYLAGGRTGYSGIGSNQNIAMEQQAHLPQYIASVPIAIF
jgi:hypothetical protein